MSIDSEKDLLGLMKIGKIAGTALHLMLEQVRPGITTAELDAIGAEYLKAHGAQSAPIVTYKFPGATCISINDEAAHGIPGSRVIREGDLVNVDVSAVLDGYFADTGASIAVPPTTALQQQLLDCAHTALEKGLAAATAGKPISDIGKAMEGHVRRCGFRIIRDLPGHGVGRKLHEAPSVPGYYEKKAKTIMKEGMVFTIEPFVSVKASHIFTAPDHWTLKTMDGSLAAQFEHTVVITGGSPILVTAV
jgi:methionyl aminopeptidase